jgi:dipeptidyl aminopeptidase/acylaminoacyl peptidase
MFKLQWNPMWLLPVASISPMDHVSSIPRPTIVRMVTGSADEVAPPALTFAFASALKHRGVDAQVIELKNKGHEILLEPAVIDQLRALLGAKPSAAC